MKLSQIIEQYTSKPDRKRYDYKEIPFEEFDIRKGETIDEELFLKFIGYTHNDSYCFNLFMDTSAYLINQENITGKVLDKLLKCIALKKYTWLKVDLCHANLKPNYRKIIEEAMLEPVDYY